MRSSRFAAAVAAAALLLAGCTSDAPDDPTPGASATPHAWTRAELEAAVFAAPTEPAGAPAAVPGQILNRVTPVPAQLRVTEVVAGTAGTVLRFTLRGAGTAAVDLEAFNKATPLTDDIRDVVLVDVAGDRRLRPYVGVSATDPSRSLCSCADSPPQVTPGERTLSAVFPPIDAATGSVTVQVPGFPPVTGVPVTRR